MGMITTPPVISKLIIHDSEVDLSSPWHMNGPVGYCHWVWLWGRGPQAKRIPWEMTLCDSTGASVLIASKQLGECWSSSFQLHLPLEKWPVYGKYSVLPYCCNEYFMEGDDATLKSAPWTGYPFLTAFWLMHQAGCSNDDQVEYMINNVFLPDWVKGFLIPDEYCSYTSPGLMRDFFQALLASLEKAGLYQVVTPVMPDASDIQTDAKDEETRSKLIDSFAGFLEKDLRFQVVKVPHPEQAEEILKSLPETLQEWYANRKFEEDSEGH